MFLYLFAVFFDVALMTLAQPTVGCVRTVWSLRVVFAVMLARRPVKRVSVTAAVADLDVGFQTVSSEPLMSNNPAEGGKLFRHLVELQEPSAVASRADRTLAFSFVPPVDDVVAVFRREGPSS